MTTDEALERLRPDWALSKHEDTGWAVYSLMNGEHYERLGWGETVAEAIDDAEACVAEEARKDAERRADYEVLPVHETAICPQCGWAGVAIRGDELECYGSDCRYRWQWPGMD